MSNYQEGVFIPLHYTIKNYTKHVYKDDFSFYVLGVDIGGTNTSLGIAGVKNCTLTLLFSLNFKSQEVPSLLPVISETIEYANNNYNIDITSTCIGGAGVVSSDNNYVELTNVKWNVKIDEIVNKTPLSSVFIINDFQTIGYGINLLDPNDRNDIYPVRINKENVDHRETKAILGAGTGLGKSILIYDKLFNANIPIPSEGGHGDFPVYNNYERNLVNFVKKLRNIKQPLTYEELLSGRGLENIYLFIKHINKFGETPYTDKIDISKNKALLISKFKDKDEICNETFRLFSRFYGRCAKNFVLDSFATGGLYIAGGIASKNIEIFSTKEFLNEFENVYRRNDVLEKVPIYVIVNYDVSIYGACFAAMYNLNKLKV